MPDPIFIVAEISKNWIDGVAVHPTDLIATQFEHVINVNWTRGYVLLSFQVHRVMSPDNSIINETIIAVFTLRGIPIA